MNKKVVINDKNFILYNDDCFKRLKKIEAKSVDMIFADPPYFLSSGGVSCSSGRQVSVDKGEWDKTVSLEEKMGCGIGVCVGCAVKTAKSPKEAPEYYGVCKQGPVFDAKEVEF